MPDYRKLAPMNARDVMMASLAKLTVTIENDRFDAIFFTEFEVKSDVTGTDVKRIGTTLVESIPTGEKNTWSGKYHAVTSKFLKAVEMFQNTGYFPPMELFVTNETPGSAAGRQTLKCTRVFPDSVTLAKFAAGDGVLEHEISGTCGSFEVLEQFKNIPGMY